MGKLQAVLIDTMSIQRYIFGSNKPMTANDRWHLFCIQWTK